MPRADPLFFEAASQLRALARDRATVWSFGCHVGPNGFTHAQNEMEEDGIDFADAVYVLTHCKITKGESEGADRRYRAEGTTIDGVAVAFIVSFDTEEKWIEIVTAFRV